jgi:hypothetical protein
MRESNRPKRTLSDSTPTFRITLDGSLMIQKLLLAGLLGIVVVSTLARFFTSRAGRALATRYPRTGSLVKPVNQLSFLLNAALMVAILALILYLIIRIRQAFPH